MRSNSQLCYLFVGLVNSITGCFLKLKNGYAYNPSQSHTTNLDAVTRGAWTRREQEEKEVASHQ